MTRVVFVDTLFLVALIDTSDSRSEQASALLRQLYGNHVRFTTTDAILLELANHFSRGPLRAEAIYWIGRIRHNKDWRVVPLDRDLLASGEARYRKYSDKSWSLTDCISMEVMRQSRIREVASSDRHFTQAGFRVLLK